MGPRTGPRIPNLQSSSLFLPKCPPRLAILPGLSMGPMILLGPGVPPSIVRSLVHSENAARSHSRRVRKLISTALRF